MSSPSQTSPTPKSTLQGLALMLLFLVAVGLRWTVVEQYEANHPQAQTPVIDEASYVEWGTRIAAGDWIGDEVFFQEPLYPYFIGVTFRLLGEGLHGLRMLQCVLGGVTMLLIWSITRELFGRGAAWLAALGFSVYPPALLLPCLLLKPNLFLPIFGLFVLWLVRTPMQGKRWLAIGALGGLGALLRGNMLILLPCFFLWPFLRARVEGLALREGARATALFLAGAALVLLPVFVRNWAVGGQFALTTSGAGTNVYGGNNGENPYGVATEFPWVRGIPRYEAGDWRREAERRLGRDLNGSESSSYWLGQVVESMKQNPGLHISILWNKLRLALNHYEVPDNHHIEWDARYVPLLRLPWPGFGLLGGLGLAGLVLACLRKDLLGGRWQVALVFVLYLGTIVVTVMSMRARLPLVVPLFPFFGYFLWQWFARASKAGRSTDFAIALLLGLAMAFPPVFSPDAERWDLAERDYNLAVSLLENAGELQQAAELAEQLTSSFPNSARLQILRADTRWRQGRIDREAGRESEGQAQIQLALETLKQITADSGVSPRERSRAYRLGGYIQADLGRWEVAERFFRSAREFAPEDEELLFAQGQALWLQAQGPQDAFAKQARELFEELTRLAPESPEARQAAELLGE